MPDEALPPDDALIAATRDWVRRAVIGLNLCPFAKAVEQRGQVRYVVSHARHEEDLLADLRRERIALPLLRDERPELLVRELERIVAERAR